MAAPPSMSILRAIFAPNTIVFPAVVIVVLAFAVQSGDAIQCWECNSHYDRNCADPFQNSTFALTDCDMRSLEHYPGEKASVCRKIIQKVNSEYRYIRGCGWLSSGKDFSECMKRAGTFNVLVQYCSCDTPGCNFGNSNSASWKAVLLGLVLATTSPLLSTLVTVK